MQVRKAWDGGFLSGGGGGGGGDGDGGEEWMGGWTTSLGRGSGREEGALVYFSTRENNTAPLISRSQRKGSKQKQKRVSIMIYSYGVCSCLNGAARLKDLHT
jgi:hypothetical protein